MKRGWPRVRALPKPPRKKRPYTPDEVESVLGWVRSWQDGRWYLIVLLIAETGRRVFEVCNLQRRDVDLAERVIRVRLKGRAPLVVPLSDEAVELLRPLMDRKPDAWVFQRKKRGGGWQAQPTKSVLEVVRRAIDALGIPDGERLDVHSLRHAFAFDADQAGLSDEDAMQLTGHETPAMLHHYRRGGVGRNTREAFEKVARYQAGRTGRTSPPPRPPPSLPPKARCPAP